MLYCIVGMDDSEGGGELHGNDRPPIHGLQISFLILAIITSLLHPSLEPWVSAKIPTTSTTYETQILTMVLKMLLQLCP